MSGRGGTDVRCDAATVAFVGAGPGDPGLLTVRGQGWLARAQVLVADRGLPRAILDQAAEGAETIWVGDGAVALAAVGSLLVGRARTGLRVVRLLSGSGTSFGEEARAVSAAGIPIEVVPGVGAATAAACYAGVPLGGGPEADRSVVVTVTAGGAATPPWDRLAAEATSLVVRLPEGGVSSAVHGLLLAGRSPETPAVLIRHPATLSQRTTAGRLRGFAEGTDGGPALLVVGSPTPVPWLERRPLFGRRVLVTRPRDQAGSFVALLEAAGAEVVASPAIRLQPPDDWGPLDAAIAGLEGFQWLIFTSANGVSAFRARLVLAGRDARALAGLRIAAIGPETAEAVRRMGVEPDVVPTEYRAEGLVEALAPQVPAGSAVLLVRAAEARAVLPAALAGRGARVTVVPAYRTVAASEGRVDVIRLLEARRLDVATFTSSSTVRGLVALLPPDDLRRLLAPVALAAIGPITAATVAEYGLEVAIMPREYTAPALARAIAAHFAGARPGA